MTGAIIPGKNGRIFAFVFVPAMLVLGGVLGFVFAVHTDHQPVSADLWKQLLTIAAITALPLVVIGMRAPAYHSHLWRWITAIAVIVAFLIVMTVIGICLYEIATARPATAPGSTPAAAPENVNGTRLRIACAGTGVILAALACGVVLEFFKADQPAIATR
jgi:hypothetical protein